MLAVIRWVEESRKKERKTGKQLKQCNRHLLHGYGRNIFKRYIYIPNGDTKLNNCKRIKKWKTKFTATMTIASTNVYFAHIICNDIHFISVNKADSRQINHSSSQQVSQTHSFKTKVHHRFYGHSNESPGHRRNTQFIQHWFLLNVLSNIKFGCSEFKIFRIKKRLALTKTMKRFKKLVLVMSLW